MEKIEMVEKLQEKTGISAEVAWSALETHTWVLVDAMHWLERENYIASQPAAASSASDAGQFLLCSLQQKNRDTRKMVSLFFIC